MSHAALGGRYVLRLAVGQMSTTEADVRLAWDVLRTTPRVSTESFAVRAPTRHGMRVTVGPMPDLRRKLARGDAKT